MNENEMQAEEMAAFFAARLSEYEAHMLGNIEGMAEAYARVAALLPEDTQTLLDLGCGTGLELDAIYARFPNLSVTGVDMARSMLDTLEKKHGDKSPRLICADYFTVDFGECFFDAATSVESLHHFTHDEKRALYRRVFAAIKPGGVYVEADFVAETQAEEDAGFTERARLIGDRAGRWHVDTPLTAENQMNLLREAGFASVRLDWRRAQTVILIASKA